MKCNENETFKGIELIYFELCNKLVTFRNDARLTQDDVAKWLGVTRKKIIEFENKKRFDVELLCAYCDKFSIELELKYKVY